MALPVTVRLATAADREAVVTLRLAAYRTAPQFTILNEAAITGCEGQVLVAECPDAGLVATMQVVECQTAEDLRRHGGNLPPAAFQGLPSLLLNRGATRPGRHYQGLNSRLRLLALDGALADERIQSLTGYVYDGAPRLNLLRELGYAFAPVTENDHHLCGHTAELFVWLRREQFTAAREQLLTLIET